MAKKQVVDEAVPPEAATVEKIKHAPTRTIHRSEIHEAEYNPRTMDEKARETLRESLLRFGVVESLVWNERNGTLVGGHQRLSIMDEELGWPGNDYEVTVSVVYLTDKAERELNIFLNNPTAAGMWDVPKLEHLFKNEDVNPFDAGFGVDELVLDLGFPVETVQSFIDKYVPADAEMPVLPGQTPDEVLTNTEAEIAAIKEARKEHKVADGEALRADHMFVVVFDTAAATTAALQQLRLPTNTQFFLAEQFFDHARKFIGDVQIHEGNSPEE